MRTPVRSATVCSSLLFFGRRAFHGSSEAFVDTLVKSLLAVSFIRVCVLFSLFFVSCLMHIPHHSLQRCFIFPFRSVYLRFTFVHLYLLLQYLYVCPRYVLHLHACILVVCISSLLPYRALRYNALIFYFAIRPPFLP